MKKRTRKNKKYDEMLLELDGAVNIVTKKNGRIVSREKLDGEVVLKALLKVVSYGIDKAYRELERKEGSDAGTGI